MEFRLKLAKSRDTVAIRDAEPSQFERCSAGISLSPSLIFGRVDIGKSRCAISRKSGRAFVVLNTWKRRFPRIDGRSSVLGRRRETVRVENFGPTSHLANRHRLCTNHSAIPAFHPVYTVVGTCLSKVKDFVGIPARTTCVNHARKRAHRVSFRRDARLNNDR